MVNKPLYYPVEAGSVERSAPWSTTWRRHRRTRCRALRRARWCRAARARRRTAARPSKVQDAAPASRGYPTVGLAMQLAYLGRVQGTTARRCSAPGWPIATTPTLDQPTTEVRVLLTKNQLNDLAQVVEADPQSGDQSQESTSTADFFDLIRSAAAHLARDPAPAQRSQGQQARGARVARRVPQRPAVQERRDEPHPRGVGGVEHPSRRSFSTSCAASCASTRCIKTTPIAGSSWRPNDPVTRSIRCR